MRQYRHRRRPLAETSADADISVGDPLARPADPFDPMNLWTYNLPLRRRILVAAALAFTAAALSCWGKQLFSGRRDLIDFVALALLALVVLGGSINLCLYLAG